MAHSGRVAFFIRYCYEQEISRYFRRLFCSRSSFCLKGSRTTLFPLCLNHQLPIPVQQRQSNRKSALHICGPSAKHPVTRKEIFFHFLWHTRQSISRFYQIFPFFHIISKSTLISILFCVHHVIMACKDNGLTGSVPSFYQSPWYRPAKAVFRQEIFSCLLRILLKVRLLCQLLCNIVCAAFFCLCIGSAGDFYQCSYIPFN